MFGPDSVLSAFEEVTGVRLERKDLGDFDRWRVTHPVAREMARVEVYDSPKQAEGRFGGQFRVRISDSDDPDDGVRDRGLERWLPERGPQEYVVSGWADRANVDVMFWIDTDKITAEAEASWASLTAFLYRL